MRVDRWDSSQFQHASRPPTGGSEAAEDFGVPVQTQRFGNWKAWVVLDVTYLAVALWVIGLMKVFNPYLLDLHNPAILLIGALLLAYFVGGYALLLFGAYRLWQSRSLAVRP